MTKLFELLIRIRECPQLFLDRIEFSFLASFISGYLCHDFEKNGSSCFESEFQNFVENHYRHKHLGSLNWRHIILHECNNDEEKAFKFFFEVLDKFKERDVSQDVNFLIDGDSNKKQIHNECMLRLYDSLFSNNKNGLYRRYQVGTWLNYVYETSGESVKIKLVQLPDKKDTCGQITVGDIVECNSYDFSINVKHIIGCSIKELSFQHFSDYTLNEWIDREENIVSYYLNSNSKSQFVFPITSNHKIIALLTVERHVHNTSDQNMNISHYINSVKRLEKYL